jgi:hypothetical protein
MIGTSTRRILRATATISLALVLQLFGAVLNALRALRLFLDECELLALQRERLLLSLQLEFLTFAQILQCTNHAQNFFLVHGSSKRQKTHDAAIFYRWATPAFDPFTAARGWMPGLPLS